MRSTQLRFRAGGAVPLVLGAVALGGIVLVSVNSTASRAHRARTAELAVSLLMVEPTPHQVDVGLHRAGLTPQRVAAAGVSHTDIGDLVSAGRAFLSENQTLLDTADAAAGTARATRDRLQRLVESGLAGEEDVTALGNASSALSSAMATQNQILADLYEAATDALSEPQRSVLATMKANSTWDLPTPYLAVGRTQAQWVALRDDLANLRIAGQLEEEPDPACEQDVNTASADPAVSAAMTNLSNGLTLVTQAWNAAING